MSSQSSNDDKSDTTEYSRMLVSASPKNNKIRLIFHLAPCLRRNYANLQTFQSWRIVMAAFFRLEISISRRSHPTEQHVLSHLSWILRCKMGVTAPHFDPQFLVFAEVTETDNAGNSLRKSPFSPSWPFVPVSLDAQGTLDIIVCSALGPPPVDVLMGWLTAARNIEEVSSKELAEYTAMVKEERRLDAATSPDNFYLSQDEVARIHTPSTSRASSQGERTTTDDGNGSSSKTGSGNDAGGSKRIKRGEDD